MSQPTAANAETAERCFSFAVAMLRAHGTAEHRTVDGPLVWCRCGKAAVVCQVNAALRAAELLPALDRPALVGRATGSTGNTGNTGNTGTTGCRR